MTQEAARSNGNARQILSWSMRATDRRKAKPETNLELCLVRLEQLVGVEKVLGEYLLPRTAHIF